MPQRPKPLDVGTPVRIRRAELRHHGWTGTIATRFAADRLYRVDLTHDCDGEQLAARHEAGPFVIGELEPLETTSN